MALNNYKLGQLIELTDIKNKDNIYKSSDVKGISTQKMFIETKANLDGVSLTNYKVVSPKMFAYVPDTSRRGDKISLAYNNSDDTYIVSSISVVFKVKDDAKDTLLDDYLFIFFCRSEFDRYARFNSFGSAREPFNWEDMCDIDIELPPLPIQKKFVDVYNAMVENQKAYESGIEDLKLVCDASIENLGNRVPIGNLISEIQKKNEDEKITTEKGVSIKKIFIDTKAQASNIKTQKVVDVDEFAFNSNTSRNSDTLSIALNKDKPYIISNTYVVFQCDKTKLCPDFLFLWFCRSEFDRYARFNSWGSARETISVTELQEYRISIPDMKTQKAIANIHKVFLDRSAINEQLKAQIKDICPILIKGSLEEGKTYVKPKEA